VRGIGRACLKRLRLTCHDWLSLHMMQARVAYSMLVCTDAWLRDSYAYKIYRLLSLSFLRRPSRSIKKPDQSVSLQRDLELVEKRSEAVGVSDVAFPPLAINYLQAMQALGLIMRLRCQLEYRPMSCDAELHEKEGRAGSEPIYRSGTSYLLARD
jgi:hypothetical protein